MRQIQKGSTDKSIDVYIIDSTDGTPELGVLFNTAGMDMEYRRESSAVVNITEVTLAALTTAHADGGFLEIGHGLYRLDIPDAAFATGASSVSFQGTVTGMIVLPQTIQLVNFDPEDSVRLGLTSLPDADADAAGGLVISDAGGLDMDAILADTNELQGDDVPGLIGALNNAPAVSASDIIDEWETQSQADPTGFHVNVLEVSGASEDISTATAVATAQADLDTLTGSDGATLATTQGNYAPAKAGDNMGTVSSVTGNVDGNVSGSVASNLELGPSEVKVEVDSALVDIHLDHLFGATYDPASKPGVADALFNELIENDGGISRYTANALEQAPSGGGGGDATEAKQDQIIAAVITNAAGVDVAADIIAIKAETVLILADTADIQSNYATEAKQDIIDGNVDDIETLLNVVDGKVDTIDANVDAILVDTGTTLDGKMDTIDANVDAILVDTSTTLPALIDDLAVKKNATFSNFEFLMVLTSDHVTPATGLTVTGQRSIDGAAFAGVSGTIAEVSNGIYQFDAVAADTNGDFITWRFSEATADDAFVSFKTVA